MLLKYLLSYYLTTAKILLNHYLTATKIITELLLNDYYTTT